MKLVNNFMALAVAQASAEAIVLGSRLGLSVETMKEVTGGTSATNGQFQMNFATKSLKGDTAPGFAIDLAHKDMGLALAAAAQNRLGLPVGQVTYAVLGAARSGDYAGKDFSALLDYACEVNHVPVPRLKG
jgi:4-hydroxybutyrate dehydrogenase/sulfolactaldehyde 3-reductase